MGFEPQLLRHRILLLPQPPCAPVPDLTLLKTFSLDFQKPHHHVFYLRDEIWSWARRFLLLLSQLAPSAILIFKKPGYYSFVR